MFYKVEQNNSGGFFDVDDKVCHRLFIEADSLAEARIKAEELGCYWNGVAQGIDCECCGDRWYGVYEVNFDELKTYRVRGGVRSFSDIEEYAQYLADTYGWTCPDARIYYKDGTVKEIITKNK